MMISLTNVEHMHYLCSCVKEDANNALDAVINDNSLSFIHSLSRGIFSFSATIINVALLQYLQSFFNLPSLTIENSNKPSHASQSNQ